MKAPPSSPPPPKAKPRPKLKMQWSQLTAREKLFAISYAKGLRGMECAVDAGYTYRTRAAATSSVNRALAHPAARDYVHRIEQESVATAEAAAILSLREKLEFCARVVRCRIQDEPDESDLWQELRHEFSETSQKTIRKLPDKRLMIELDNKLQGHGSPEPDEPTATDILSRIIADIAAAPRQRETMDPS